MIRIKNIRFNNIMSYGLDNELVFENRVTQMVGDNGAGKSSIPIILEELFYNKNSRGVPKAALRNRFTDAKEYSMSSMFEVDGVSYLLTKRVASTAKVVLVRDGVDISGHTATQTYKILEGILGLDFQTFTKLVYQSIDSSLDFLKATDANRKKFLVSLLGLEKYIDAETQVKEATKTEKTELAAIQSEVDTITTWITKNAEIPELKTLETLPEELESGELTTKLGQISSIEVANKAAKRAAFIKAEFLKLYENPVDPLEDNIRELSVKQGINKVLRDRLLVEKTKAESAKAEVAKVEAIKETCHVCKSKLEVGDKKNMLIKARNEWAIYQKNVEHFFEESRVGQGQLKDLRTIQDKYQKYSKYKTNRKAAEDAYDSTEPTQILDPAKLSAEIQELKTQIARRKSDIQKSLVHNQKVIGHNSAVEYQIKQLETFNIDLGVASTKLEDCLVRVGVLDGLVKALGSKGLIAYKIESMVKVFETLINEYLQTLSKGNFVLSFSVESSKLTLSVYDSGHLVKISSLSSGEFNNVNTATLLAVRKMMCSISKIDINVLYIDEVMSVLDEHSKDTLINILLKEQNLNTIVVSHGYSHPLAEVINVVKTNKISELINES